MEPLDEVARRRAITWAMRVAADTPLAPDLHEQALLEAYARGAISLAQLEYDTAQYRRNLSALPSP